ncbi:HIG1 domain family member 1A, mitochondrial isoform X2 [Pogona vitticeps]|uniref:HIG1 domain family member 1A, mitochondrial n=1 Tax=Pogona vitticeps TaxID=103695 RepID=A0A6J0U9P9_9SAUR|nr:HIG1 domain family member 1A, mitochondrial [Pogona vitticeps]XP_020655860.1 HIG1 domain family member 1A, mitochondrial [Pogona vitticeps]
MSSDSEVSYSSTVEESGSSKFIKKSKESPFVPIGIAGFLAVAAYGIYKARQRGDTKLSVHLIHTRVAAQGFVVGAMTCGVAYAMLREYWAKPKA